MAYASQLSVNKHGVIKIGATVTREEDLDPLTSVKVWSVTDLQFNFWQHTIWLVGDLIHVLRAEGNQTRHHWSERALLEGYCAMNAKNLMQLADYLKGVEPAAFDMSWYTRDEHGDRLELGAHECGTVACAAGYGPAAGIEVLPEDKFWGDYVRRAFAIQAYDPAFEWCFSAAWCLVDNTPAGAAKRIEHMLEHGIPENWKAQMYGWEPYLFAMETA
ncbi:hypothetical protein [Rhizobium sp. Leaf383]|uniref:hypothetical protein n=1 Tax=Rhizobium sp. Leaf383 TaxID=1736357 RepID=UPI0007152B63|nr:hypothetical protein [Rhizobium sp. Leaf383]KQS84288.1 hypothetical protein ASG58_21190 [Rhizobium sp. Leaf383]